MTLAIDQSANQNDTTGHAARAARVAVAGEMGLVAEFPGTEAWDREIATFDGICQEQLSVYARGRWPKVGLEPVLFRRDGQAVGGALVMLQPLPLGIGTIALVKWGPILAASEAADGDALMNEMVGYLRDEYAVRRGAMVSIIPAVEAAPDNRGFARLMEMGFVPGDGVRAPNRYVVDVTLDDDARMAAFGQKWRYHLRKSLKAGLAFEHAGGDGLERFMTLYDAMSERKQFADYSAISTVSDLFLLPEGKGRPELFYVTHKGETVAGAIIFATGRTATYLYGATNDAALGLRAGYFLHWHIIRWLRDNTLARWYDLGGTDGSHGLHQFKSGMVGTAGYINPLPPMANYAAGLRARLAGGLAYTLRNGALRVRDGALEMFKGAMARLRRRGSD